MADSPANVRLKLVNTAENVVLIREILSGLSEAIELTSGELVDVRTAVTEACNNVVLHAYAGDPGPLEIELYLSPSSLDVVVRDRGIGLPADPQNLEGSDGIGLHVMRTLARTVEFNDGTDGGTEVWMSFDAPRASIPPLSDDGEQAHTLALAGTQTTICIAPIGLARTILPRLLVTLAAHAHFSTDRISDAQLLADALATHAQEAITGEHLSIEVAIEPRDMELHISPLGAGRAQQLVEQTGLGEPCGVIGKLTDRCQLASAGAHETLTLGLSDPH